MSIVNFEFNVNSFVIPAKYFKEDVEEIFKPLLKNLTKLQKEKKERLIVFLAAPPGTGKSTVSLLLEHLSKNDDRVTDIQSIGLDGFHYKKEYIEQHTVNINGVETPMKKVKGCAETFDIENLTKKLSAIKKENILWPIYDRTLHDVVEDKIEVTKDIVLIEGNWLLLKEGNWEELKNFSDYSIFIEADKEMLKERLINRKISGGLTKDEAIEFYERSDSKNVIRVLEKRHKPDLLLNLHTTGKFNIKNN